MQTIAPLSSNSTNIISGINRAQRNISEIIGRLSSGEQNVSGAENSAYMSMSNRLHAQVISTKSALQGMSQSLSLLATADNALEEAGDMITRIKELATQAADSAITTTTRTSVSNEASSLLLELDRISTSTEFNDHRLLDGFFNGHSIQTGPSSSDTMTMGLASSAPTAIGAYISTGPTREALAAAQTVPGNSTTNSEDIVFTSNGLETTVDVADADSAKSVAAKINAVTYATNIEADAQTFGHLFSTSASSATYTIKINGNSTSSFSISSSDVTDAVSKINLISTATGVVASATTSNKVLLHDSTGGDITIENAAAGGDLDIQTVQYDGETTQGNAVSLADGGASNNDASRIIGNLIVSSKDGFTVSQLGSSSTAYLSSETPSLTAISSIDLSSSNSASSAIAIIDSAIEQISGIRSSVAGYHSRIEFSEALAEKQVGELSLARAKIIDVDFAAESAKLAKEIILKEINTAVLAQANASSDLVLKLLNS